MLNKPGQGSRVWIVIIIIVAAGLLGTGYWLFKGQKQQLPPAPPSELPRMANLPAKEPAIKPPPEPTYAPDAPVLEQARKALREGISPVDALALARGLPDKPERADAAFLLLEYAADGGNSEAAMAVGEYYDPSLDLTSGSIRKNPARAYEWYRTARDGGHADAQEHLKRLRQWVETRANNGSVEANALLENWE